ncbi:MAG: hypothetical protein Wins2KO_10470 [Winogradskyella sp.]
MENQKLPNSTLILIFGILSIVTCCCYGIVGIILGVIAIVLAGKATAVYKENPELYSDYNNVKIGRILSYVGITLSVIYLLITVWMISTFGWEAMQDQELMQERIQEMLGQ